MSESVKQRVIEIIANQALIAPDQVADEATLEDLGLDSLALVEAVFVMEERFDISIPFNANDPDHEAFDISNVASIVRAVEGLVAARV